MKLTIKRAKELAISENGKLPKCGYETMVFADFIGDMRFQNTGSEVSDFKFIELPDRYNGRIYLRKWYLSNIAGRYQIHSHTNVNTIGYMNSSERYVIGAGLEPEITYSSCNVNDANTILMNLKSDNYCIISNNIDYRIVLDSESALYPGYKSGIG